MPVRDIGQQSRTQSNVDNLETRTLESDLVALERVHRAFEQSGVLGRVARDVESLKLDGNIQVLRRRQCQPGLHDDRAQTTRS